MKLKITHIDSEDVYKDMARIPKSYRHDYRGALIPEGRVCKVIVNQKELLLSLRGSNQYSDAVICIDEKTRNDLELTIGTEADFNFRKVGWWGQFLWAWRASDPIYRIAARVALVSLILGAVGLLLGVVGIYIAIPKT